jgi:hypothetical protein
MKRQVFQTYLAIPGALLCLTLLGMASTTNAAELYKWIDENGVVRYSDHVPQSAASKQRQTLNDQGVVLSTKEAAKTAEERAALKEQQQKLAQEKKQSEAQRKKDQTLLLSFGSEAELELARNERMDTLDSIIRLIYKSMADTKQKLDHLENLANQNYLSKGVSVPGGLAQNIESLTRKNFNREKLLRQRLNEKNKIEAQYDIDLARFRELTN